MKLEESPLHCASESVALPMSGVFKVLAPEPWKQPLVFLAAGVLCVSRPKTQTPPRWGRLGAGLARAPLLEALLPRKGSGSADG